MNRFQLWVVILLFAFSPLVVLYLYTHDQHSKVENPHRKHIVVDYLKRDSASLWARIVHYESPPKLIKAKKKSKAHFEYEFKIKNKKYRGKVYEHELHTENLKLNVHDSIRVIYSQSDPFLNIPHIIFDDLKD